MKKSDLKALFGTIDPTTLTQAELARVMASWNNRPIDDFCGLSSVQMDDRLYNPLGGASPIRIRQDIDQEVFEGIPSEEKGPGLYPAPPFDRFVSYYGLRTFTRFLGWFGWIEEGWELRLRKEEDVITASRVFREVFETEGRQA